MKNLNSKSTLLEHKAKIITNLFLNKIYLNFYSQFKEEVVPKGKVVELGSGAGFLKDIIPKVITTDVLEGEGIDKVFFAEKIPFKKSSIAAFYMLNTFHHIKDVEKAISEMDRCLVKKGKIVMIETYNTPWASFIYKNFHHEAFEPSDGWKISGSGRLTDSNQALPWIVFERDRRAFENKFPNLKIKRLTPHTPLLYLLSGGLSKKSIFPYWTFPFFEFVEWLLSPLNKYLGMFATIVIVKK